MTSTTAANRRKTRRHSVSHKQDTWIEFELPRPGGRSYRFPLVDVSVSGFSFALDEDSPTLDNGAGVAGVTVQVGDCALHGDLLVLHVTPTSDTRSICGALFYPADDTELVKLKSVVAGVAAGHGG